MNTVALMSIDDEIIVEIIIFNNKNELASIRFDPTVRLDQEN